MALEYELEIGKDFKLSRNINKELVITEDEVDELETILTYKESYGSDIMSCFDPHLAFFYYLGEKIIGSIDICLECNYLTSSEKIPAMELKEMMISNEYTYSPKGFSKKAREEIYNYLQNLGFKKYLLPLTSLTSYPKK